ncbi:MAG: hypothetical protein GXY58_06800 [Planctomycetaceae bacterium]|nr:hypothetical protein [Planctomycetaceae bacterium]
MTAVIGTMTWYFNGHFICAAPLEADQSRDDARVRSPYLTPFWRPQIAWSNRSGHPPALLRVVLHVGPVPCLDTPTRPRAPLSVDRHTSTVEQAAQLLCDTPIRSLTTRSTRTGSGTETRTDLIVISFLADNQEENDEVIAG